MFKASLRLDATDV